MLEKPVVLLVEDEAVLVLGLEDCLLDEGLEVYSALNGMAAIAELDSEPDGFACLVTDIRLGGDTDGWTVARHARQKNPDIAVIYMTGQAAAQWPTEGVPDSILLEKPFTTEYLALVVANLMAPQRLARSS